MNDLTIRKEYYPERCEVCHQSDSFDPYNNYCSRCHANEAITNQQYLASIVIDKQGLISLKDSPELSIIDSSKIVDNFDLQKIIILSLGTILCINKSIMTQNYIFFLISAFVSLILLKTLIYKYRSTLRIKSKSKAHTTLLLSEIDNMQLDCKVSISALVINLINGVNIRLVGSNQLVTAVYNKISTARDKQLAISQEENLAANNGHSH